MPDALILLVPLLMLPVVLLLGFAGCVGEDPELVKEREARERAEKELENKRKEDQDKATAAAAEQEAAKYHNVVKADPADLVGYWRLDELETGDPTAYDSALAPPNHGEYRNLLGISRGEKGALALVHDANDKAAEFHGEEGYVEVPFEPSLSPPNDFSIEAWVRPTDTSGATQVVVGSYERENGDVVRGFVLEVVAADPPKVRGTVGHGTGSTTIEAELGPGTQFQGWYHVALAYTRAAKALRLYVNADDGKADAELGPPTSAPVDYSPNVGSPLRIAAGRAPEPPNSLVPAQFFKGRIDEVALYRGTLTGPAVRKHFLTAGSQNSP